MAIGMNKVWLMGDVSQYPFKLSTEGPGQSARGTLVVTETTGKGKAWSQYVPVEVFGEQAPAAAALAPGTVVSLEGTVVRKKNSKGEWDVVISTYRLEVVKESPLRSTAA